MENTTHDLKRLLFGFLLLLLAGFGIVACAAGMKYGAVNHEGVYVIAGVIGLVDIVYAAVQFFNKYLKY